MTTPVDVLLVDDDEVDRRAIRRILQPPAYRLREAATGDEGLARAAEEPPACVLLDYQMPGLDGLEVLRALREREDPPPVIMLTGLTDPGKAVELMKAGASDYLSKDRLDAARLHLSVQAALRLRQLEREAADEARRREELQRLLVGIVGHDLRTPLGAVTNSVALLLRGEPLSEPQRRAAARIQNAAHRMARLIGDLLDFTRVRSGQGLPLQLRSALLCDVVRPVLEETEAAHPDRKLVVAGEQTVSGRWDPERLAQVAANLLGNAVKYGSAERPVTVRWGPDGAEAFLSVHNHGPPIPPELQRRIFEPLVQHAGTSGIGLGLFISAEIVRAHGGSMSVRSGDAEGTTFEVRLPCRAGAAVR